MFSPLLKYSTLRLNLSKSFGVIVYKLSKRSIYYKTFYTLNKVGVGWGQQMWLWYCMLIPTLSMLRS